MNKNTGRAARRGPFAASAMVAVGCALTAQADAQEHESRAASQVAAGEPLQEIVVTGSRIDRAGFEAPTPTTVVSEADLRQGAKNNVAAVLGDLPQFRYSSNSAINTGNINTGSEAADLRGLGAARTLLLLDNHRFVGGGDLNSIPFSVVERVEVVTGGASAAWGSGAVAGVVNLILDDDYNGLEVAAQSGVSTHGDGSQHRFGITGGSDFADGRGNFLLAGEYYESSGISSRTERDNVGRWAVLGLPNGQRVIAPDVGFAIVSRGGLILSGPLAGQQFNADGTLSPFERGSIVSGQQMSGGDGPAYDDSMPLTSPLTRVNGFGRATFDLTDSIKISTDLRYSKVSAHHGFVPDVSLQAISLDNAFLPAAVRNQLTSGFTLGRFNDDLGIIELDVERENIQATVGIEGTFGSGWRWDGYYSHGEQRADSGFENLRIASNFAEAVDSVISPTTGRPICRSALTVPTTACVPINLFGQGAPSAAALRYVQGDASTSTDVTLDVGAASLRGEPFSIWAGPVSVAVGFEARREASDTKIDDLSKAGRWASLILAEEGGSFSVEEGFGEVVIPLVRDVPGFNLLEFNGAARLSDYSTSGSIWSWKLGVIDQVVEGLRVRAVRSRDIRSGSIAELFTAASLGVSNVFDPFTGQTTQIQRITGGNVNLEPELADTHTIGMIFEPTFIPGLSISADYYSIDVGGAITTLAAQDIVTRCFDGNAALCSQIVRNDQGQISQIFATYINLSTYQTSGVDFELAYRLPMASIAPALPGRLTFRVLGSYVDELITDDGVIREDTLGNVGTNGVPQWRGFARVSYENENLTLDLRARYVGGGKYNAQQNIVNNDVSSRTYVDLGFQYGVPLGSGGSLFTLFGNVSNLFDKDPPILPNAAFYDVVGRYFTLGGRMQF